MQLIVGLGNPGAQYKYTKHNVGFLSLDSMQDYFEFPDFTHKHKSLYSSHVVLGEKLILAKPQTYMNNSGQAVQEIVNFYKIEVENILVIHDDIDLDHGRIKIKKGGGSGGHNGIKSIDQHLGNVNYYRFRIGVGRGGSATSTVLGGIREEEMIDYVRVFDFTNKNFNLILQHKFDDFMNKYALEIRGN
jgi:PTH1 family peptidyl-tRNA hydrolase